MLIGSAAACCLLRIGILHSHHLKMEHFNDRKEAFAAADKLVEVQRARLRNSEEGALWLANSTDIIIGIPEADLFFYIVDEGRADSMPNWDGQIGYAKLGWTYWAQAGLDSGSRA